MGATLALLGAFGIALAGIGAAFLVVGVIVSAPYASNSGPYLRDWWNVLGIAALVVLVGFGVWFLAAVVGGILVAGGAVAALVAVGLGVEWSVASSRLD